MLRQSSLRTNTQHGAALLIFALVLISVLLGGFLSRLNSATQEHQRDRIASESLARAKEALIGYAISYRDKHPNQVFGFLPCPDTDNDGDADPDCGIKDVSVIGRLPWKTLGLPPPRDASGECLWYAVSGHFKPPPATESLNWDSLGQFIVQDPAGTTLAGVNANERPAAVIFAPRSALTAQSRAPAGVSQCGGNNDPAAYLEGVGALGAGDTTITLSNADSIQNGNNNDQGLWITGKEIFDRIIRRSDFKTDIDALVDDVANHLNNQNPADLPSSSPVNKGIKDAIKGYAAPTPLKGEVLSNWQDNLLYAGGPAGNYTLSGSTTPCRALLFFGGERTTRTLAPLTAQTRSTVAEKGDDATLGDATMYLEGDNALRFPANGAYTGATRFDAESPSTDLVRCINGLGSGSASFSKPSDFDSFKLTGVGVTKVAATSTAVPTYRITDAPDATTSLRGGCLWFPGAIPLAGKTLRAYYDFQFSYADTFALDDLGSDRGNGFTFQMLRGDLGVPTACGTKAWMGALNTADTWGMFSFIVETDVQKNSARNDPSGNHTAIMTNGNLTHAKGTMNAACNGTLSGCKLNPANAFEESPTPLAHTQRIEIHSGCNAGCTSCNPASHGEPNTYARIAVWVDCSDCDDVVADLNRNATTGGQIPTVLRCENLATPKPNQNALNSVYFGFTGGFSSGAAAQGVSIKNFTLRSD